MLEQVIKNLKKLERETHLFSSQLAVDADGYLDRECPNESCLFQFKILNEHWIGDDTTDFYCPSCCHRASKKSWYTQEQVQEHTKRSIEYSNYLLDQAFHDGLKKSKSSFNKQSIFSIQIKPGKAPIKTVFLPIQAKGIFQQKIDCESCQTKFAVVGAAFFCPRCGHNSSKQTLNIALTKVQAKVNNVETVKNFVAQTNPDEAILIAQSMLETCLSDCVVAFQRFCEVVYKNHPAARASIPINSFQRLQDGSNLWKVLLSEGYEDWLTTEQLQRLNLFFQRRHLLQHSEGMVDDKYIQKSADSTYQIGQRIVVKSDDVLELLGLVETLIRNIREKVGFK